MEQNCAAATSTSGTRRSGSAHQVRNARFLVWGFGQFSAPLTRQVRAATGAGGALDALGMDWTNCNDRADVSVMMLPPPNTMSTATLNVPGVCHGRRLLLAGAPLCAYRTRTAPAPVTLSASAALLDKLGTVWEV